MTLPEPIKLRQGHANEEATLSDFQAELVLLSAAISGDSDTVNSSLDKVKDMIVVEAAQYTKDAFAFFIKESSFLKDKGIDDSQIFLIAEKKSKQMLSFAKKFLSRFFCGRVRF